MTWLKRPLYNETEVRGDIDGVTYRAVTTDATQSRPCWYVKVDVWAGLASYTVSNSGFDSEALAQVWAEAAAQRLATVARALGGQEAAL